MKGNYFLVLLLLGATFSLSACAGPVTYSAEPIEVQIVDAETMQPLEGAVVVAHWVLEGGIHVDRIGDLVILETVTDKTGRFNFPSWGPIRHWKPSRLTNLDPEILIFKSGYESRRLINQATKEAIEGKAFPARRSDWHGKIIKMKKFSGTLEEYARHFESLNNDLEHIAVDQPEECNWKKLPRTITAMANERKVLEGKGVNPHIIFSLDKRLLMNDEYFTSKGKRSCGSPKAFLRSIALW